jgi:hypothetical protein
MAAFQTMTGASLPSTMTLFVGNVLKAKIVPDAGELVPFKLALSPAGVLSLVKDEPRVQANFQVLEFKADAAGTASVSAENAKGVKLGPLSITVKNPLVLPSALTNQGALARLFLAEAPSPYAASYTAQRGKAGMEWMELVVQNRLQMRSALVGSAGADNVTDVIKAPGQFEGFGRYPVIGSKQQSNIDQIVAIANDGTHPKQKQFFDHVSAAIDVARVGTITDPCPTLLLSWRTAGASGPGGSFVLYKSFAGQDFYTIPAAQPKGKK